MPTHFLLHISVYNWRGLEVQHRDEKHDYNRQLLDIWLAMSYCERVTKLSRTTISYWDILDWHALIQRLTNVEI
jgi:hypothetical protein